MLLRFFSLFLLLLATTSSFASECPPDGTSYTSGSIVTGGSKFYYANYLGFQCRIKATGVIIEIGDSVSADWVYEGGLFKTYKVTSSKNGRYIYTTDVEQATTFLLENADRNYITYEPPMKVTPEFVSSSGSLSDWVQVKPCTFYQAHLSHSNFPDSNFSVRASYECYGTKPDSSVPDRIYRAVISQRYYVNTSQIEPIYERPTCQIGYSFNYDTNSCQPPPRIDNEKCSVDATANFEYIKNAYREISENGCHMIRQKILTNPSMPVGCYSVTYKATGKAARSSDIRIEGPDFDPGNWCDFTPPECSTNPAIFRYSTITGLCHATGYKPYHPTDENHESNLDNGCSKYSSGQVWCDLDKLKIDDSNPENDSLIEDSKLPEHGEPDLSNPNSDRDYTCRENNRFIYCNYDDNNDPVAKGDYPPGSAIDPDICNNGYSGSNCDHNSMLGGTIPRDDGAGTVNVDMSSTNSILSGGFDSLNDALYIDESDENSYREAPEDFVETESVQIDPVSDIMNNEYTNNGLDFGNQCPEPQVLTIFDGTSIFGKDMSSNIHLEYDSICAVGNAYRNFFIFAFVFFLLIDLIRRVA